LARRHGRPGELLQAAQQLGERLAQRRPGCGGDGIDQDQLGELVVLDQAQRFTRGRRTGGRRLAERREALLDAPGEPGPHRALAIVPDAQGIEVAGLFLGVDGGLDQREQLVAAALRVCGHAPSDELPAALAQHAQRRLGVHHHRTAFRPLSIAPSPPPDRGFAPRQAIVAAHFASDRGRLSIRRGRGHRGGAL